MKNVKKIIAMGQCKNRVMKFAKEMGIDAYLCDYITDSTKKAYEVSEKGDVILLSPGSASWDQYDKCEDRGDLFKEFVNNIK